MQRSDDSGRNLRGVWLGPENAFRWPFDATFTEWLVGATLFAPAFVVLWLVTPLGLVIAVLAWSGAGWIARNGSFGFGSARVRRWTWFAVMLTLVLLLAPALMTWVLPMPWWLALPSAVATAALIVRAVRPYLDANRPVSYWITTLQNIASGPRPLRPAAAITPEGFTTIAGHDTELGDELWRFMAAVNAADPKETTVLTYRERSPEVEAVLWDIGSGDERTGQQVVAWLRAKGLEVQVSNVRYAGDVLATADVHLEGLRLPQKCVLFLHKGNPQMWGTRTIEQFNIEFEEVHLAVPTTP